MTDDGSTEAAWRALVARCIAGDADARDELVCAFYPRVQAVVHCQLQADFRRRHQWMLPLFIGHTSVGIST